MLIWVLLFRGTSLKPTTIRYLLAPHLSSTPLSGCGRLAYWLNRMRKELLSKHEPSSQASLTIFKPARTSN